MSAGTINLARPLPRLLVALSCAAALLVTSSDVSPAFAEEPAATEELPPGGTFLDDDGNVHEGYIEAIAAEEITRGCGSGKYCPDDLVSRGEMAAFLARALELPASEVDHFTDDDGHTFEADINALADSKITAGCTSDGTSFCPDDLVTRGQMAAFLRRAGKLPAVEEDHFTDDDGHRFEVAINAIAVEGVTKGCDPPDNTSFCPDDTTRRDQMASFLGRFLGLTPNTPPERPVEHDPADTPVIESIETWFPEMAEDATKVAYCESSHNPRAVNPSGRHHGLFQISRYYHEAAFERVTGVSWNDGIYVAYYNAQFARVLWDESGSWRAWECKP